MRTAHEAIQHLTAIVGADVTITLEISAGIAGDASSHIVRTVTENCQTLGYTSHGFDAAYTAAE